MANFLIGEVVCDGSCSPPQVATMRVPARRDWLATAIQPRTPEGWLISVDYGTALCPECASRVRRVEDLAAVMGSDRPFRGGGPKEPARPAPHRTRLVAESGRVLDDGAPVAA